MSRPKDGRRRFEDFRPHFEAIDNCAVRLRAPLFRASLARHWRLSGKADFLGNQVRVEGEGEIGRKGKEEGMTTSYSAKRNKTEAEA